MKRSPSIETIPVAEKEPVVEGIDKTAPEDKATIEDEGEEKPDEKKPDVIVEEKKEDTDKTEPEDEPTVEGEGDEEADENKAEIIIEDKKEDTVPEADPKEEGSVEGDEENEPEEMKAEIIVEDLDRPRLGRIAPDVTVAFKRLQMRMHRRGRFKMDRLTDLPYCRGEPA